MVRLAESDVLREILLLDVNGELKWRGHGLFREEDYAALRMRPKNWLRSKTHRDTRHGFVTDFFSEVTLLTRIAPSIQAMPQRDVEK